MWQRGSALLPALARAGLARATSGTGFTALPPQARNAARAFAVSPRELSADRAEFAQLPRIFNEAKAVSGLGARPLAVVTAGLGTQRGWLPAQKRLAKLSIHSTHRKVAGATHGALLEDKAFASITSRAITQVVHLARSGRRRGRRHIQPSTRCCHVRAAAVRPADVSWRAGMGS